MKTAFTGLIPSSSQIK